MISARAVPGLPEITPGADLAALILERVRPLASDVVVVAHKAISKAEGRVRLLADIRPGARAFELLSTWRSDTGSVDRRHTYDTIQHRAPGRLERLYQHRGDAAGIGVKRKSVPSNNAHGRSVL